jgi:hypothetical protein
MKEYGGSGESQLCLAARLLIPDVAGYYRCCRIWTWERVWSLDPS